MSHIIIAKIGIHVDSSYYSKPMITLIKRKAPNVVAYKSLYILSHGHDRHSNYQSGCVCIIHFLNQQADFFFKLHKLTAG